MSRMIVKIHAPNERGDIWETLVPYRVNFGGRSFLIPRHFESDGASVPRLFWRVVFPPTDSTAAAAGVAHDFIYRIQPEGWSRKDADRMFLAFLIENGASYFAANAAYLAVRLFGRIAWNENRRRSECRTDELLRSGK